MTPINMKGSKVRTTIAQVVFADIPFCISKLTGPVSFSTPTSSMNRDVLCFVPWPPVLREGEPMMPNVTLAVVFTKTLVLLPAVRLIVISITGTAG